MEEGKAVNKKTKHFISVIRSYLTVLVAVCMAFVIAMPQYAKAESVEPASADASSGQSNANSTPVNVIILIDKSGSMQKTDKEGQAKSAAMQFLDIISTDNSGTKLSEVTDLAIISFDHETTVEADFTSIKSDDSKSFMKDRIRGIQYGDKDRDTDIGLALKTAADLLQKQASPGDQNAVFLFTDGKTEGKSVDLAQSQKDLEYAINTLSSIDKTDIYALGWNYNNTLQEDGIKAIQDITNGLQKSDGLEDRRAGDTSGKFPRANYLITDQMQETRNFMTAVAEHLRGGIVEPIPEGKFDIDSSEIVEAHVIISSADDVINDVNIITPSGDSLQPGEKYSEEGDDHYKVCKLFIPEMGTYTVQVNCKDESTVSKLLVKRYAVEAKAHVDYVPNDGSYGLNSPFVGILKLVPIYNNDPYRESSFIDTINTKVAYVTEPELTDDGGTRITPYNLEYDDAAAYDDKDTASGCFVCAFPVAMEGSYGIEATIATDNMKRTVALVLDPDTGITRNADGSYSFEVAPVKVKRGKTIEWQPDQNLQFLRVQAVSTDDEKTAAAEMADGGKVKISGKAKGQTSLNATAQDQDGITWYLTGPVEVAFALKILEIILIVLGILLVAGIIFFLTRKLKSGDGLFSVRIEDLKSGYMEEFNIAPPRGTSFSLWDIASQTANRILTQSQGQPSQQQNAVVTTIRNKEKQLKSFKLLLAKEQAMDGSKHDTYKCKHDKFVQELSGPIYNDQELRIDMTFSPRSNGFGGFGNPQDKGPTFGTEPGFDNNPWSNPGQDGSFGGGQQSGGFGGFGGGQQSGGFGGFGGGQQSGGFGGFGGDQQSGGQQGGGFGGFGGGQQGGGFGGFGGDQQSGGQQGGGFGGYSGDQQSGGQQGGGFGGFGGGQQSGGQQGGGFNNGGDSWGSGNW